MKELVDFTSRKDFDRMMGQIENSYFDNVAKVSKFPYSGSEVPQFPPKPYQSFQQNERDRSNSSERRSGPVMNPYRSFDNFVDTVNVLNS